jgi:PiT family inorganic phosphate transporter
MTLEILLFLIVLALGFDFLNGFHDAANSIATVVSTGVLKPQFAVAFAAFFNFVAYFLFPLKVAATVGQGIIDVSIVDHYLVFGALVGAIAWNIITWVYGIPSSSSHALVGGLVGAAVAKAGTGALVSSGLIKTVLFIVLSPMLGFLFGSILMVSMSWILLRSTPWKVDKLFRRLQLVSASLYSLGHGGNDAQKTIGVIWMLLISANASNPHTIPDWMHADKTHMPLGVAGCCYVAIAMGTMFGGWRIVRTMGQRITKLKPVGGFCAETSGAITLFMATALGIPVSTTHTITGAIVGVGSSRKVNAVRWGVAGDIVWAWILTIPCSAFIAAVAWWIGKQIL